MGNWLTNMLLGSESVVPPTVLRRFKPTEATLSADSVSAEDGGWLIETQEPQVVRLFEINDPDAERCVLTYRATLKSEGLEGRAFLEMWCRFPGRGEFFSKGLNQVIKGTTGWSSHETLFRLKKGERPDLVKLNLAVEGRGKIWIKDVELLKMYR